MHDARDKLRIKMPNEWLKERQLMTVMNYFDSNIPIIDFKPWQPSSYEKMKIETVNVLKRHPPHQRAEHISSPPIDLQHSEKIPHPKGGFCLILKNVRHTKTPQHKD